jgi:hypothetical protein
VYCKRARDLLWPGIRWCPRLICNAITGGGCSIAVEKAGTVEKLTVPFKIKPRPLNG